MQNTSTLRVSDNKGKACKASSVIDRLARPRHLPSSAVSFEIEQKWDGIVHDVSETAMEAAMTDPVTGDEYEITFELKDLPIDERVMVQPGALFDFFLGYEVKNGTRKNGNLVKFRRRRISMNSILDKMNELNLKDLIEEH